MRTGHPLLGAFAPDGPVVVDGRQTRLRTLLGAGFVGLVFASDASEAADVAEAAWARPWDVPARLVAVLPPGASADGLSPEITVATAVDDALEVYGTGWWLVRPDGHLAARDGLGESFPSALRASAGIVGSGLVNERSGQ